MVVMVRRMSPKPSGEESKPPAAEEARQEVSAALSAFRARDASERKRREKVTDSEFWFCACFASREDKEAFLKAVGLLRKADKYIDGYELAKAVRVDMAEPTRAAEKAHGNRSARWKALT